MRNYTTVEVIKRCFVSIFCRHWNKLEEQVKGGKEQEAAQGHTSLDFFACIMLQ